MDKKLTANVEKESSPEQKPKVEQRPGIAGKIKDMTRETGAEIETLLVKGKKGLAKESLAIVEPVLSGLGVELDEGSISAEILLKDGEFNKDAFAKLQALGRQLDQQNLLAPDLLFSKKETLHAVAVHLAELHEGEEIWLPVRLDPDMINYKSDYYHPDTSDPDPIEDLSKLPIRSMSFAGNVELGPYILSRISYTREQGDVNASVFAQNMRDLNLSACTNRRTKTWNTIMSKHGRILSEKLDLYSFLTSNQMNELKRYKNLRSLNLSRNIIDAHLLKELPILTPTLESLDLSGILHKIKGYSNIDPIKEEDVLVAIKELPLKELKLRNHKDIRWKELLTSIQEGASSQLELLDLRGCPWISKDLLANVHKARPNLTILTTRPVYVLKEDKKEVNAKRWEDVQEYVDDMSFPKRNKEK